MLLPLLKLSPAWQVSSAPGPTGNLICCFSARMLETQLLGQKCFIGSRKSDKLCGWWQAVRVSPLPVLKRCYKGEEPSFMRRAQGTLRDHSRRILELSLCNMSGVISFRRAAWVFSHSV